MSQLNLTPDPVVLITQATIFFLNMVAIKKLMLEPYLKVRSKRESSTGGNQDAAAKLIAETANLEAKITEQMKVAHREASQKREAIKLETQDKRSKVLQAAETHAKTEQQQIEHAVQQNLLEERTRKDESIAAVADGFFKSLTQT